MESNLVTVTVQGREYVLYKVSAQLLMAALGSRAFTLAEAAQQVAEGENPEAMADGFDLMHKVLAQAMVKPRLVDGYDEDPDTVTWFGLGGAVSELYAAVMDSRKDEAAANFQQPLAVQMD